MPYRLLFEQLMRNSLPTTLYVLLLGLVLLLAYVFGRHHEQVKNILVAGINPRTKASLERSDTESIAQTSVFLNVIFFTNFLLLFWMAYRLPKWEGEFTISFSLLVLGVILLFGIKYLFQLMLGKVFKTQAEVKTYLQDTYLKYRLYGVLVFPILLFGLFSKIRVEPFIILGFAFFLLMYIAHSIYGLQIGLLSKSFPKHYAILYICTLEILPLILVFKLFWSPVMRLMGF